MTGTLAVKAAIDNNEPANLVTQSATKECFLCSKCWGRRLPRTSTSHGAWSRHTRSHLAQRFPCPTLPTHTSAMKMDGQEGAVWGKGQTRG
jgi:hypothetical protein